MSHSLEREEFVPSVANGGERFLQCQATLLHEVASNDRAGARNSSIARRSEQNERRQLEGDFRGDEGLMVLALQVFVVSNTGNEGTKLGGIEFDRTNVLGRLLRREWHC